MNDDPTTRDAVRAHGLHRSRRPRLDGFDYSGRHVYHLVTVTRDRQPLLTGATGTMIVERLLESAARTAFDVLVYCVMPDHLHLLAQGTTDDSNAVRFIQRFKQVTAHEFVGSNGEWLWQQSFFDRVLRKNEDAHRIGMYIIDNAVRAGLVKSAEAWPLSGGSMTASASGIGSETEATAPLRKPGRS